MSKLAAMISGRVMTMLDFPSTIQPKIAQKASSIRTSIIGESFNAPIQSAITLGTPKLPLAMDRKQAPETIRPIVLRVHAAPSDALLAFSTVMTP